MTVTRHLLFITGAIVCFLVGFLIGVDVFSGDQSPWLFSGLGLFAASQLP